MRIRPAQRPAEHTTAVKVDFTADLCRLFGRQLPSCDLSGPPVYLQLNRCIECALNDHGRSVACRTIVQTAPISSPTKSRIMNTSENVPAEELSSAVFDHESAMEPADVSSAERELFSSWQQLGDDLRSIPTDPVDLSGAVRAEILTAADSTVSRNLSVSGQPEQNSRALQWLAVTTSLAALVMVCINLMYEADTADNKGLGTVAASDVSVVPDNWEVVVVTVRDEAPSDAVEFLRNSVTRSGLQIHSVSMESNAVTENPELLMAPGGVSETLRNVLSVQNNLYDTELNPGRVGSVSREELLARFAESLESPTQSDRYFGSMYVVLPGDHSLAVQPVPAGRPISETLVASAAGSSRQDAGKATATGEPGSAESEAPSRTRITQYLQHGRNKPVLVVFVRRKTATGHPQGSLRRPLRLPAA